MNVYIIFDDSDADRLEYLERGFIPEVGDELVLRDKKSANRYIVDKIEKLLLKEENNVDLTINIHVKHTQFYVD